MKNKKKKKYFYFCQQQPQIIQNLKFLSFFFFIKHQQNSTAKYQIVCIGFQSFLYNLRKYSCLIKICEKPKNV